MAKKREAFTLFEVFIIVMFLGILAAIAVPRLNFAVIIAQKGDTVAGKIVTDLRRARRLAISNAADNTDGFALNMTGSEPYSGYEIVNLKTSTTIPNGTFSIDSDISCTGGANFEFGPLGNLKAGSDTQLVITAGGKTFTITIISATGTIKCVQS